ncbi:MAG TPA: efflux RND transporter periplasmic adaptor subunit [Ignavibacteriaceae bacterium]|nr:efflux RND transporter periplasmic adaptor subunit [Ignavibacteriaceae bacterium]
MMKSTNKISIALIFVLAVFISGCSNKPKETPTPPVVVQVKVDYVRTGNIEQTVTATGQTSVQKVFQITSPLTGVIVKFKYYNGDVINQGDEICLIRTKESQAAITGAELLLRNAVTSQQKSQAESALMSARKNSNEIKITAPFTGILTKKIKNEGEVVVEGEQLGALINDASIIFIANVPASSISKIKRGETGYLKFASFEGKEFYGTVKRIEPSVNVSDQTIPVQIEFNGEHKIFEDALFGEVSILIGRLPNQLIVPVKAVLHNDENNTNSVFLINSDSIAYSVNVEVIQKVDSTVAISSPLIKKGMPVIVEGSYGLPDSTEVRAAR